MTQSRPIPTLRTLAALVAPALMLLLLAGCGSSDDGGGADLATLSGGDEAAVDDEAAATEPDSEQALLSLAECMRENGVPEFVDPIIDADGVARFDFRAMAEEGVDPQSRAFTRAVDACGDLTEGVTLGGGAAGGGDPETEDQLLALAECMREQGIESFPDPDLGGGAGGPFGDAGIDLDDPAIMAAFEVCQDEVNLPDQAGGPGQGQ